MSARKLTPFKNAHVLWRLRAAARTGVTSPSWVMAAVTSVPPANTAPVPKELPKLRLPIDRLVGRYERRYPDAAEEELRAVDGMVVSRSFVFAQKQHELMKKGMSEEEAFTMAEKALVDEEKQTLEKLKALTQEARQSGAVPAVSSLNAEDDRWETYQFWRGKVQESPYESWPLSKRASVDHWLARQILGWQPHQTRYIGKEEFSNQIAAIRQVVFGDIIKAYNSSGEARGVKVSEEDLLSVRQERAQEEYQSWEERLVANRGGDWGEAELTNLATWLEQNQDLVASGLKPGRSKEEDEEHHSMRAKAVQWLVFPLLRPEFQGLPYLSETVTRAFLQVAKLEAGGLKSLINGPLGAGKKKTDLASLEASMNDALPKLVVKVHASVALERPFTWRLLGYVLTDWIHDTPMTAFKNLPDLRSLSGSAEVANYVGAKWQHLTERLTMLAQEEETASLGEDIAGAYQAIHDLHRVAEEILHDSKGKTDDKRHALDRDIKAVKEKHHGWIDEDLAVAEVLRRYDPKVNSLFLDSTADLKGITAARELLESDILETARLDGGWTLRERARLQFELQEGLRGGDSYDQYWLKKRGPDDPQDEIQVNPLDMENWRKETDFLSTPAVPAPGQAPAGESPDEETLI